MSVTTLKTAVRFLLFTTMILSSSALFAAEPPAAAVASSRQLAASRLATMPLAFEQNQGQADGRVK